jgi:hypothetical protein
MQPFVADSASAMDSDTAAVGERVGVVDGVAVAGDLAGDSAGGVGDGVRGPGLLTGITRIGTARGGLTRLIRHTSIRIHSRVSVNFTSSLRSADCR